LMSANLHKKSHGPKDSCPREDRMLAHILQSGQLFSP
jgi:hypothetical protein